MVILGLGSNIGNRLGYLELAIKYLNEEVINITSVSAIYESPALLKEGSPEEWQVPFFNMAVAIETELEPHELLKQIKIIENKIGRLDRGVWAPREIDIDILAYDGLYIDEENLKIPHAALCERSFALLPLADLCPNWQYPASGKYSGKTASEIALVAFAGKTPAVRTAQRLNLKSA